MCLYFWNTHALYEQMRRLEGFKLNMRKVNRIGDTE